MNLVAFLLFTCFFIQDIFASCPNESVEFQNHCYFFETNATNFPNAELACNNLNGHLASIHDGFTNAIITGQSGNYFHDSTTTDFWIGLNSLMSPGNWSWTDGTTFDFKEWAPKEPQNLTMNCGTLAIQNGLWAASDCFKTKPFVCEIAAPTVTTVVTVTTTPTYPAYMNCTEGWVYFEPTHSCYGHNGFNARSSSWTDAEQYCESVNAHLPSLHSYDEARFLSTVITFTGYNLWTGLISYDNEVSWKWSDGSPVDYLPWASGYPNYNVSSCAYLYQNKIYDYNCSNSPFFVCKKPASL